MGSSVLEYTSTTRYLSEYINPQDFARPWFDKKGTMVFFIG